MNGLYRINLYSAFKMQPLTYFRVRTYLLLRVFKELHFRICGTPENTNSWASYFVWCATTSSTILDHTVS